MTNVSPIPERGTPHTRIGDERREALIDAAYQIIAAKGMEGLRLRDVAAQTGLHHATLHYYFPTKPDLIKAIAARLATEFVSAPAPDSPPAAELALLSFREQLHWYLASTEHQLRTAPDRFLVTVEMILHARRAPAEAARFAQDLAWQTSLAAIFVAGQRRGEVRADLDATAAAELLVTFSYGLPLLMSTQPATLTTVMAQFEQMLLSYASPPPTISAGG